MTCLLQVPAATADEKVKDKNAVFECSTCKKTFTTAQFLRKHAKLHTGENVSNHFLYLIFVDRLVYNFHTPDDSRRDFVFVLSPLTYTTYWCLRSNMTDHIVL